MKPQALLVLAHQGRSYIHEITRALEPLGVKCLVLSSDTEVEEDLALLKAHCDAIWVSEGPVLTLNDVDKTLTSASDKYTVLCALATFEGYRLLMSRANERLNRVDAETERLKACMDKYICRNVLLANNLSECECFDLNAQTVPKLVASGKPLFVKPRRGAGSFSCFRLSPNLTHDRLVVLQQQMQADKKMSAIFNDQFGFMAESYIEGEEYSFEVLVVDGACYVIGIHAKYLEESMGTTLEMCNSLPAPNLGDHAFRTGERFVAECLAALGLSQGGYHIESRYDSAREHWEIIEINARMGGALINQSVEIFTGGESFLKLWIETLCVQDPAQRAGLKKKLDTLREGFRRENHQLNRGTIFVSRYGEPGRVIDDVNIDKVSRRPDICQIPVRKGMQLPQSERGIFVLNALWSVAIDDLRESLESLPKQLDEGLSISYMS